jgi:rubrerythrin
MRGVACNGWRFWSVLGVAPGEARPAAAAEPTGKSRKPATAKAQPLFKQVRKVPNQNGLAEGDARWFCSACMKGFVVSGGDTPETCPEGHPREVADEFEMA